MKRIAAAMLVLAAAGSAWGQEQAADPLVMGAAKVTEKGTLVTLHLEGVPLRQGLAALKEQAGVVVESSDLVGSQGSTVVTYSADEQPVMEVVKGLMDQLGADKPVFMGIGMGKARDWAVSGRLSAEGPFLMVAEEVSHVADFRRATGQQDRLVVKADLVVDPSLRPTRFVTQAAAGAGGEAVDENGLSLAPAGAVADESALADGIGSPFDLNFGTKLELVLSRPAGAGKEIRRLTGKVPVWVADKMETFSLKKEGEQVTKELGGVKMTLGMAKANGQWTLSYRFERPEGMSDEEWKQRDRLQRTTRLWFVGSDGKVWERTGTGSGSYGDKADYLTQQIPPPREGGASTEVSRGMIEVVVSEKRVEAGYRFAGLPLP